MALLVQNLERLDESVKEEADGVHNTLGKHSCTASRFVLYFVHRGGGLNKMYRREEQCSPRKDLAERCPYGPELTCRWGKMTVFCASLLSDR